MPDASHPSSPDAAPRDWSDAFNALPLEAPATDTWPTLARHLDGRRGKRYVPAWLGLAAAAALVAVIAWPHAPPVVGTTQVATTPIATSPAVGATQVATTAIATPSIATPPTVGATQVATTKAARPAPESVAASAAPTPLESLQTESARLESLLLLARNDHLASASALTLVDAFDDQVAAIDAALGEPGLDDVARESLWRARVEALQQSAGFASTQRLMAAQGYEDALLVSVD